MPRGYATLAMVPEFLYPRGMGVRIATSILMMAALTAPALGQQRALERAVAAAEAQGVRTGVVVCTEDADILYRHRAGELFAPASNMKVLTAAVTLSRLGRDYQFVTDFAVVDGVLCVRASGDPNWISGTEHDPEVVLGAVGAALRSRGVQALRGVSLDAGVFTGPSRPATWPQDQLYAYYCAPTGAFVLQQGTFVIAISASGGRDARARLISPPAGYPIRGAIREVASSKGATYGAIDEGQTVRVRGKFYAKSPRVEIKTSVRDPARWFEDTLVEQIARVGVSVSSTAPQPDLGVVYRCKTPLAAALRRMLEDSSNFDAEQCLRVLGAEAIDDGSLAGGVRAMRQGIAALVGRVPAGVVLADGSGLSKENRITPGLLVVAMYELEKLGLSDELLRHLPVAGQSGTLRRRFVGGDLAGKVRAKTGWIRGASSLSGVVERSGGDRCWFSILMNYDRSRGAMNKGLKKLQEDMVAAVHAWKGSR